MIYKEKETKNPLYVTVLDNGVVLMVYDGYAEGSDNKTYQCVTKENGEGDLVIIGWQKLT